MSTRVCLVGTTSFINRGSPITKGKTKKDIANMVRRKRLVGDIPPPYPNGWYELMRSEDLPIGQYMYRVFHLQSTWLEF